MRRERTQTRSAAILILIAVALWLYSTRTLKGAAHTSAPETPPRLEPSIVANIRRNAGHGPQSTETTAPHAGTTIAICTLTKSRPSWKSLADTTLQKLLIPSIEHTVSEDERSFYSIELHIGADHDDAFWIKHHNSLQHPPWLNLRVYFYTKTRRFRLPFNDLTDDAYANGADYLVRINDDTEFVTNGWVTKGVAALRGMRPPNVGVIGPHFKEGHTGILTHDMVHRTHINIFGTYYPTVFDNWYVDDWITRVYGKDRTLKLDGWRVKHHTTAHGQRYVQSGHQHQHLENEVKTGAAKIDAWLSTKGRQAKRVVSYSLYGSDRRYTDGIVENAKLMPTIYPGWEMRVYYAADVPEGTTNSLRAYDHVELVPGNTVVSPMVWRFLVASDPTVSRYIVRDADSRLSVRERAAVDEWVRSDRKFHVMRDHPSHSNYAMSGGLWGGTHPAFPDMKNLLSRVGRAYIADMNFLTQHVWPVAKQSVLQHDAFGCRSKRWGETRPFPTERNGLEHVGSVFINGKMRQGDIDILKGAVDRECTLQIRTIVTNKNYILLCDVGFKTRSRDDLRLPLPPNAIVCARGDSAVLEAFFKFDIQTPFTLVTIESDEAVPQNPNWLKHPHLTRWYGWNSVHPNVRPIPIGLNHDTQLDPMKRAVRATAKSELALVNFKRDTDERVALHKKLDGLPWTHVEPYKQKWTSPDQLAAHYETISRFKWTVCPRGAGQDTHRLWEALYLGSIPVVLKSSISTLYAGLPVIELNSWDELSLETLRKKSASLPSDRSNAYFEHWAARIAGQTHEQKNMQHRMTMVVGMEGTGHQMMKDMIKSPWKTFQGCHCLQHSDPSLCIDKFYRNKPPHWIYWSPSWPFERPPKYYNATVLLSILERLTTIDVRVLVLTRSFKTVQLRMDRVKTGTASWWRKRMLDDMNIGLCHTKLPVRRLHYDDFIRDSTESVNVLFDWLWGATLDKSSLRPHKIKHPNTKSDLAAVGKEQDYTCLFDDTLILRNSRREWTPSPICIGIIAYQGVKTLENTLSSFKRVELFRQVAKTHILFQKIDSQERRAYAERVVARYPDLRPTYERENIGFEAFGRLQQLCDGVDTTLIVEEDFAVSRAMSAYDVNVQLRNAVWFLTHGADAVMMRSRRDPGYPNWAHDTWQRTGSIESSHLIAHVYWDDHAEMHVPEIRICKTLPKTWCAQSANAHYTNNPTLYRTRFSKKLYEGVPANQRKANLEPWLTKFWQTQNFTVAHSDAVFTHKRIDRTIGALEQAGNAGRNPRTVIIAAAVGYGPLEFRQFLVPLRRVYDGDVVLFVNNNPPAAVIELCTTYRVSTRVLPTKSKWGIVSDRFVGYAEACGSYDWCFATDFRDVFFQADPFGSVPNGYDLILAQEHATKKIKDCPYNSGWIKDCYDIATLETIGHNSIICAGTLMGTPVGFEHLKHAMLQEMKRASANRGCTDQGHLNYLYYSNKLRVPTLVQPRGKGIVNTVGYIPRAAIGNYLNEKGLVKNDDGSASAVVHQYDRFPVLKRLASRLQLR